MGLDARKPDFGACQQQRRRPTVMHLLIRKKCSLGCLDIFLISNIQNIGINRLFWLHLSFNFTNCQVFICEFIFHLIVFHIPLCNVRQPYKGCPLTCFLAEITRNETVWRMRTNNVKRVYCWLFIIYEQDKLIAQLS